MTAFRELSVENRIKTLKNDGAINESEATFLLKQLSESSDATIPADVANHMIEHQIGKYTLPVGVVRGLIVNGEARDVLVATEEPSVIAAACNGARIAAETGIEGCIVAQSPQYVTTAQIAFEDADGSVAARLREIVEDCAKVEDLLRVANESHPSMSKRGGGARKCRVSALHGFAKLEIDVDTCDAMGANTVNTMGEAVKAQLESWLGVEALVAILTNTSRVATTAEVRIPVEALASRRLEDYEREREGKRLARRIAALSALAASDPERAATHNKGILNGIAGAALASGNDTRALEAAAHAWAARSGRYLPLSTWNTESLNKQTILHGRIEIPLQIGIVGGSISSLPMAKLALKIGKYKNANDFRNTLAALGLVQNLAALRALAGHGIQAGHMALQASNLAIAAGAKGEEIEKIAKNLLQLSPAERTTEKVAQLLKTFREPSKN
ncbi:hydroxymethylglutaryl-CoA reductase, degradative [Gardnerella greenwoodii]|uniref:3-hydroxy-3-methylglutaryl coenzyme A reductase n=1 Tax=Gardnerella greenwoodii TaxID=2914925 RepID=A0A2N6RYL6_9BIFI|nr:hydroxymethylglutaryl-CoA reductase, degradative [Gardnerella greenwoodii]MDF0753487.1 hydroxymethylglutaryl-CoA reductase, degradative [Gardnerella greenwoodii]PMC43205.1 hydroxymethylglutaryl-CoA reductase, degradative [Gardnerella greenwoodii]